jgi:poly(hydroxyalkanoate) granule-associated protein
MVKKQNTTDEQAAGGGFGASPLAGAVKESAQQIWLAGMGAFAKAQEGGGKVFEALVKEGTSLQKRTQAAAEERLGEVAGKMSAMAETVTAKAGQNWDKLETIFEQRTAKALAKLGVPTAADVAELQARIAALEAAAKSTTAAAKSPARRVLKKAAPATDAAPAKKPTRRRTAA